MNPQLRINADQQMDVIRHDFQFFHLSLALLTHLTDDLFQARFNRPNQDFPPIFRAPNYMVVASIKHVPVALVGFTHWRQYTATSYLLSRTSVLDQHFPHAPAPSPRNAAFIPMTEAQGLSAAALGKRARIKSCEDEDHLE
jgi:hypothetical protein